MISVDISNIWGPIALPDLLAMEQEIFAAHKTLEEGTGAGNDFLGWRFLADDPEKEEVLRIRAAAKKIRESCDVFVVVGIGGSYLGPRAAIELVYGQNHNMLRKPEIYFAGNNLSTNAWNELVQLLEGKDFCERKYGAEKAKERIFVTTDPAKGALRQMATEEGYETFVIPPDVGGRFSVLSAVGLLPMAVAGIDPVEILSAVHDARMDMDVRSFDNPVWQYAAARNLLYRNGKVMELLCSYEPDFSFLGRWWQQLFGESEGKDGKGIFPACAEFTADLHSLGQMIQQGERNFFETVVKFAPPRKTVSIEMDWKDLDGLNYLEGKTLDFVQEQAFAGTLAAHTDGGVHVLLIQAGEINVKTLGELFYFFELSCGVSAYTLGVNPFNQPGVEFYKRNMFHLLGKPGY